MVPIAQNIMPQRQLVNCFTSQPMDQILCPVRIAGQGKRFPLISGVKNLRLVLGHTTRKLYPIIYRCTATSVTVRTMTQKCQPHCHCRCKQAPRTQLRDACKEVRLQRQLPRIRVTRPTHRSGDRALCPKSSQIEATPSTRSHAWREHTGP